MEKPVTAESSLYDPIPPWRGVEAYCGQVFGSGPNTCLFMDPLTALPPMAPKTAVTQFVNQLLREGVGQPVAKTLDRGGLWKRSQMNSVPNCLRRLQPFLQQCDEVFIRLCRWKPRTEGSVVGGFYYDEIS